VTCTPRARVVVRKKAKAAISKVPSGITDAATSDRGPPRWTWPHHHRQVLPQRERATCLPLQIRSTEPARLDRFPSAHRRHPCPISRCPQLFASLARSWSPLHLSRASAARTLRKERCATEKYSSDSSNNPERQPCAGLLALLRRRHSRNEAPGDAESALHGQVW
jgi:hypothetical protein